jgi:hypothetical protein
METMKYNLQDFMKISFNGFDYTIPEETMNLISSLSIEVGSPTYIKTPIFKKRDINDNAYTQGLGSGSSMLNTSANKLLKKRKGNKGMEVSNEEWESLRTFQTTKIEQKTGIDGKIDQIRLILNKLSDKTFLDICEKIKIAINEIIENNVDKDDLNKIGKSIFELASTNKFYSKIYADLYSELINTFEFLRPIFESNYYSYMDIFSNIECCEPEKDYDRFCEINKINEKRKAISMFFVNLCLNGLITKKSLIEINHTLLKKVLEYINISDKKNEVDELTENIAILYNKEIYDLNNNDLLINGKTILETITDLAKSKSKDYKSLSNKAIFKYMDLIEM